MKLWTILIALTLTFTLGLAAAEDTGYIKARGNPGRAGMFVDGKYVGPPIRFSVPEKYAVTPGDHEVTFKDPRYEDYTTKVTVRAKKTTHIHFKLKAASRSPSFRWRRAISAPSTSTASFTVTWTNSTTPVVDCC